MKSLIVLWREVLKELSTWCCASTTLDLKRAESRLEHEGLSFLTITLPAFAKDFERGLELGRIGPNLFTGFQHRGMSPLFLSGFMDQVFDRRSGYLLDNPSKDSIFAIRQLTLMFGKIQIPCSDTRISDAFSRFVESESIVTAAQEVISDELLEAFSRTALRVWAQPLSNVDRKVYEGELVPRHGPGATADRVRGNAKFDQTVWHERLESYFPYGEYAIPSWRYSYLTSRVDYREPGMETPVRVIAVPKTLKTPRIIALEPVCMQYTQQAILEALVPELERTIHLSSQFVGFSDQTPNQEMAREGSLSGNLATLDLKDASDLVSNRLVRLLLARHPHLRDAVDACRSRNADVPGHGVISLSKFASMGSALCFPVEAMVFATICLIGIAQQRSGTSVPSYALLKSLCGQVRVYGDDIIVPADCAVSVTKALEDFGLRVNQGKSFRNGKFRESCGKEYYDGRDVSITRVRRIFPSSRKCVPEVESLVSLRNQLYLAGLWKTCRWLDTQIVKILPHYPAVATTSPVLGRYSFLGYDSVRSHAELQVPLVRGYVVRHTLPASKASGEGALLKWFLKRGNEPFADRDHLERTGRPQSVDIKLRWARAY